MAFFDCVSDFVDSLRDRVADSTNRILLLKPNFIEATKREQQTRNIQLFLFYIQIFDYFSWPNRINYFLIQSK
jgi:hypothetical protein